MPAPNVVKEATTLPGRGLKVGMISLGCAKNLVDAEIMLGSVVKHGMEITANADEADVLVVNTCAFIDSAKEESIDAILQADQERQINRPNQKLIVSGCMSQRYAQELHTSIPEVDAFIGLDQVARLGEIIESILSKRPTLNAQRPTSNSEILGVNALSSEYDVDLSFGSTKPKYIPDYDTPRFRLTPSHSVYLKIAEGCNHPCSFCVIPQMRGKHRSRSPASVLSEMRG
ncbi:MAG: ribosomal protein methylthiotransferase [Spartobacteria bacterium]|nr:ribosomal protein methylthiotransferase [Spartobacteria bacterium]